MAVFNPRLLTPPSEEEEIRPYREVWRSIRLEYALLFAVTVILFVGVNFLGIRPPEFVQLPLNITLVLLPAGLWVWFSVLPERMVPRPRTRLVSVAIISGLVANAVGYPIVSEFLQVDQWLSLAAAIPRIIGYTFTVGITQEILKYLVVRVLVWSEHLRTRQDALAYAAAVALGYATVLNLHFALTGNPPPDVVMARVFSTLAIHMVCSAIVSYGLAESYFSNATFLLLPASLALASLITGLAIPLRAGLVNASISPLALEFTVPRPLFGIGFSAALLVVGLTGIGFFYQTAERQERELRFSQED